MQQSIAMNDVTNIGWTQGVFLEIPPHPLTNKAGGFLEKWAVREPWLQVADVIEQDRSITLPSVRKGRGSFNKQSSRGK